MQIASHWSVPPDKVSVGIDSSLRLKWEREEIRDRKRDTYVLSEGIEPVSDVGTCCLCDGNAQGTLLLLVVGEELGQVVDAVEERNPAVVMAVVAAHLAWCVVPAQFVGLRQVGSFALLVASRSGQMRCGNSSSHS